MSFSLVDLHSEKARLEAELDQLRVRLSQLDKQYAAVRSAQQRGRAADQPLEQYEQLVLDLRREIQRRKIALSELGEGIARAAAREQHDLLLRLEQENEAIKRELDLLRREVRGALLGMTDLLRRQQRLAEKKLQITQDLARLNGRDYAYENYLCCSLLQKKDLTADVQFVVDTVKKMRPVS